MERFGIATNPQTCSALIQVETGAILSLGINVEGCLFNDVEEMKMAVKKLVEEGVLTEDFGKKMQDKLDEEGDFTMNLKQQESGQ